MRRTAGGELRAGLLGRGVRRDRPAPGAAPRASTGATRSPSTSATRPPTTSHRCSTAASSCARWGRATSSRPAPSTSTPSRSRRRADVRHRHFSVPDPRRRPHRPPPDPGRQPAGLQRQPDDRARHARPPARDPRARRQARRHRPAPQRARPRRPTSTTSSAPAPTRCCCSRSSTCCSPRASSCGGAWRARRRAWTKCARSPSRSRPRRSRRCAGSRQTSFGAWRASWPRPSAAVYGRIGTCTQEFGTLATWLVDVLNVLTGNLDRPGGAMFTKAAAGASNTSGEPGKGRGVRFGRWHSRVRGLGEVFGELPVACLAEEIETPGEGQVRALVTIAGNPCRQHAQQRPPAGAARDARLHGQPRHLPQRDDAPRRRDPARPVAARALALRPRAVPVRHPQRGQLLAAGVRARRRHARRVGDAAAAHGDCRRPGRRRRRRGARRHGGRRGGAPRDGPGPGSPVYGRDPGEILAALDGRAAAPSACST